MKFLIVLPEHNYYLWQMLVQMNNLKKFGYDNDTIYIVGRTRHARSQNLENIIKKSRTKCRFYTFRDDRKDFSYSPALTAHLLSKFFEKYPDFQTEKMFYMDPDVIFKKKIRFNDLEKNDIWHMSDTRSYINSAYIKSKGEKLFREMCEIVGIDPKVVEANDDNAGGAQIFMKNTTPEFWKKVENDSIDLHKHMATTAKIYSPNAPIQAWTAEMWSLLWNAWLAGHKTKIVKRFDFCWATDRIDRWEKTNIYHNAGAVNGNDHLFIKTKYQKSPFNQELECSDEYCSTKYVEEIKETEKTFENILF